MTMKRTPLYDLHVAAGARIVDFGGWDMPVNYGSQIEEHHAVRRDAGMFDVSHMCVVDLRGAGACALLLRLLANDVGRLTAPGKALYSCMLRPDGGVIDDLIVYLPRRALVPPRRQRRHGGQGPRLDQGAREGDRRRSRAAARPRDDRGAGPECADEGARHRCRRPAARRRPRSAFSSRQPCDEWFVARTGYTGEDGYEIMLPAEEAAVVLASAAGSAACVPCGLGARDTLRLEAGMNLYGNDMDETVSPLESGLAWTVALEGNRDFIGKAALEAAARRRARTQARRVCCCWSAACCARTRSVVATARARARSRAARFRRRSSARSASRGCPRGDRRQRRMWTSAASRLPARIVKPPFVRNGRHHDRIVRRRQS